MPNDWILEVLEDLRVFAQQNDLPAIETEIARVIPVARTELTTGAAADTPIRMRQQ